MTTRKQRVHSELDYNRLESKNLLAQIQILAAGSTNQETIELQIDGSTVRTFQNLGGDAFSGDFVTLTHTVNGDVSADQIRIAFTNDLYDPANGIDRNPRIDAILIDGTRYETEDPTVFSTGTWTDADGGVFPGFKQSEYLHSNGYFQFDSDGNSGTQINVIALGSEGGEQFDLRVDGSTVASFSVTQTAETYSATVNGNVEASQVRIVFYNSVWLPDQGIDSNLIVDYITIDGEQFETEAPNVFSTGTWKDEDGIQPGFRESEFLHADGYFQYDASFNAGTIQLESSVINVAESDNSARFRILRSGGSDGAVTVDYRTVSVSATPGNDYQSRQGTVTFQNGETVKTITVPILEDNLVESNEQFSFTIDNVTGGANLLAPRTATVTIDDNDSVQSQGDGLLGEYFDSRGFTNRFLNRVDPTVDFTWNSAAPADGMGSDSFSVRWTGQIEPRFSQNYTFTTRSDDGVRLWVDNQLIIDEWNDHAPTNHQGTISLKAGQLYDIRMEFYENGGGAVARLFWASASQSQEVVPQSQLYAADPPPPVPGDELVTQNLITGLTQPTSIDFSPNGSKMYIAEQSGIVRVVDNGNLADSPFLDFRDRVNGTRDRGLLDIAVHPDFENTPYLYLLYTYDPPQVNNYANGTLQGPDGNGNRAARLTRVTADASTNFTTIVPNSEVVLVGKNSTWANFNGFVNSTFDFDEPPAGILADGSNLNDFIATDSESHTIGSVEFGSDGALYVSIGDGTSYNRMDPRTVRVQDIDNLSGKILRVNPINGRGLSDNPFYNGDANANRSKVFQYGVRNPFRITVNPDNGQLFIGDVGWTQWEEINTGDAGANFGWPYYEGANGTNAETNSYRNLPEAQAFYNSNQVATPSLYGLNHAADGINAIVLGDIYTGDAYPAEYQGDLFFNDLGQGIVRNISFDAAGNISSVDTFATGARIVVQIVQGPDGNMYFVDLDDGTVGRWVFQDSGNAAVAGTVSPDAPVNPQDASLGDASGITVAIIDSGVDSTHPNLAGSLWTNSGEIPGDGIDNDSNGFVDDYEGYNFINENGNPRDLNGHGTFTAGLIAGTGSGLSEYQGIANGAKVMNLRVMNGNGRGSADDIARAIRYAVDNGANVISLPLTTDASESIRSAIAHAAENEVLIVVASGNDSQTTPSWLASLSNEFGNVLSVGAVSPDGVRLTESNRVGDSGAVQLDAEGIAFGLLPDDSFGTYQGSSVAAARASAAAALAWAAAPDLDAIQIRQLLIASAEPTASDSDSAGTLNIYSAISLADGANQVILNPVDQRLYVTGTNGSDEVVYSLGQTTITINGIDFDFASEETIDRIVMAGNGGSDRLTVYGTDLNETALIRTDNSRIGNQEMVFIGNGFDYVTLFGNLGADTLALYDTVGDDSLTIGALENSLAADGIHRSGFGFESVRAYSSTGADSASFEGTNQVDRVYATTSLARMNQTGMFRQATGFSQVTMNLRGGFDPVIFRGDANSQELVISPNSATFEDNSFRIQVNQLERTTSNGLGGIDTLRLNDGEGRDVVNTRPQNTLLVGIGYDHRSYGFETTTIVSSGGTDRATIIGSAGADAFLGRTTWSRMSGETYETTLRRFPAVLALASDGEDTANLIGSEGSDDFFGSDNLSNLSSALYSITTRQFETTTVDGRGGEDSASLVEGSGDGLLQLGTTQANLLAADDSKLLRGFESLKARSEVDSESDLIEFLDDNLDYVFNEFGDWEYL
jgi:glucose/arabinose dehydrogenase